MQWRESKDGVVMRNVRFSSTLAFSFCMATSLFFAACEDGGPSPSTPTQSPPTQSDGNEKRSGLSLTIGAGVDTAKIKLVVKQVACGSEQLDPAAYFEKVSPFYQSE
ncbi:MAG TPA: hypothetical protein PLR06_07935 [Cyclobacteriaceae bacterium]|nr:hypothetical protein [Cyclobacteriaceae bacterium]